MMEELARLLTDFGTKSTEILIGCIAKIETHDTTDRKSVV